ncbi:MAG: diacylglycerol kinase family lipid kinase [Spirochaetales bacterium]|nr:diacylglycerol kinase family lipid kinase [Spirochaetales bacterium]
MKICLIVNPNAGKKRGLYVAETVSALFRDAGIHTESLVSLHPGGTREIAEALDLSHWDGVVAVGGDGTLFEVINGLLAISGSLTVPVGQIPVGTGNSFSRDLEIQSVEDAVARIVRGSVRKIDLGHFSSEAGDFYFANLLGAGFVSNVAYRARKYKALGSLSYIFGIIEEVIGLKSTQITLEIDGKAIEREGIFVEICNSRFTGGNMMMAPAAEIDDGLLDVIILNKVTRRTLLKLLPSLFKGKHVESPFVEVIQGKRILLRSENPLSLTPDGETFGTTPIDVTVHHQKLEMFG